MVKQKVKKSGPAKTNDPYDGMFALKLVVLVIVGTLWLKIDSGNPTLYPIPIGFIAGMLLASHERFSVDRKIEYAVLVLAMLVGYWAPFALILKV